MLQFLSVLAAAAAAQPAELPTPAPPPVLAAPDSAAISAARELLIAGGFETQMRETALRAADSIFAVIMEQAETRHGLDFPADLEADLRRIMLTHIDRMSVETSGSSLNDAARIYARYFTADELRELLRLQSHPVMVKFQSVAPQFMGELMQIGVRSAAERQPELDREIAATIEAWIERQRRDSRPPA